MKLAYICTEKLPSPAIKGGAIQLMIDGVAPFLSNKFDLTIFSVADPALLQNEYVDGIYYIRFPSEHYAQSVANELPAHHFDVIHVFNRPAHVPVYKEASPETAIVLSLHNDMFSELKLSFQDGEKILNQVHTITTVSEYIKRTVIGRFPNTSEKITVVYSGVNLKQYPPSWSFEGISTRNQLRKKYQVQDKKVILFIGRLSKTKGPHVLIKAMSSILKKYQDAVLVIVGGKWFSENTINAYVQGLYDDAKQYGDSIIFTKYIPAINIPSMLLMGDVFVCSSQWHEPLARVHYEAMAAGIPVITTNRGGNAEVITHKKNGIVIDGFRAPDAFANAISTVFSDPNTAEQMAKKGREMVEESFQFKHVAAKLGKVYLQADK